MEDIEWARLPFGRKVSSEIFQRKFGEVFGNMTGVFSIVDDIIIAGCGANDTEAKTVLKEISFHEHVITKDE